jgi:hypothetical protein
LDPTATNLVPAKPRPSRAQIWTARLLLCIEVIFFIELGMVLLVLPWTPLWQQSHFTIGRPALKHFMEHPFTRGAFSGLGLINLWMGIWEAVRYREDK